MRYVGGGKDYLEWVRYEGRLDCWYGSGECGEEAC